MIEKNYKKLVNHFNTNKLEDRITSALTMLLNESDLYEFSNDKKVRGYKTTKIYK